MPEIITIRSIGSLSLVLCLLVGGCATSSEPSPDAPRQLSLSDFARVELREPDHEDKIEASPAAFRSSDIPAIQLGAGDRPSDEELTQLLSGAPSRRRARTLQPGDRVLVDALVGQINGRPLYADEILEPLEDQLIAESEKLTGDQFIQVATDIVFKRMQQVVLNELFLSEAESSLSSQEREGLLFFLRNLRELEIAKRGGSKEQAERDLRQEKDLSLDDYLERSKEEVLINDRIIRKINARVIVSWLDIQREYEKNFDLFNPPATVTLSRIRVDADDNDRIEEINRRLEAGEDFGAIAEWAKMSKRGLMDTFTMGPGGISDIEINEAYKPPLQGLVVGQSTEGFAIRNRIMWIHVDSIDQPPARSLYDPDIQNRIAAALRSQRYEEEQDKYIANLLEKGSFDEMNMMVQRLLVIAIARYAPDSP